MLAYLNPVSQWHAAREVVSLLITRRELTWEMTKRDLTDRYAGQVFGALWTIGHPLLMTTVYVFLFTVVFKARIDQKGLAVPTDFTVYILAGLLPWLMFQESMSKGSTVILSNASLVKQVVFPIEILPAKVVLASIVTQVIFIVLLMIYILVRFASIGWIFLLIPVLMTVQAFAMLGISYGLSAIGCYFRDLKDFVMVFATINLYLMPVVYVPEWVPSLLRPVVYLNPFSSMIWCYQDVIYFRAIVHPWAWVVFPLLSVIVFSVGYRTFRKVKVQFGNLL